MDSSTPEKPEVLAITSRMGWDDPDMTVGKLFRVWRWFDQHTTDGNAARVTSALLDRIAGVAGFAQAMQAEGWLIVSDAGLSLPKFDRHNGATAKARAQTAKRVANHRAPEPSNADSNARTVTQALAREEKRRDKDTEANASVAPRATRKCPKDWNPETPDAWIAEHCPGLDWPRETAKFRDHTFKTAHSDWDGAWRNWMRRAVDDLPATKRAPTFKQRDAADAAERVRQMTGGLLNGGFRPENIIDMETSHAAQIGND